MKLAWVALVRVPFSLPLAPRFSEAPIRRQAMQAVCPSCMSYITPLKQGVNKISKQRNPGRDNETR